MGLAGQTAHPDVMAEAEKVLATCRDHNIIGSIPMRSPDQIARWRALSINMLIYATDGSLLMVGARTFQDAAKRALPAAP
jgi:2-keto-3-deoxy-L-rhamnonate aldolase RhmA